MNALLPWQKKRAYAKIANACTLSKAHVLEDQFVAAGADVIATQEGRAPASVSQEGHSYTMMRAAAFEDGSRGVQIWTRHGLLIKTREAIAARFMFAIISKKGVDVGIASAHGPQLLAPVAERAAWRGFLGAKVTPFRQTHANPWHARADIHGRAESVLSAMFGPAATSGGNDNGARVRELAGQQQMMVANARGPEAGHAWTSSHGTQARVDFISVPVEHVDDIEH